MKLLFVGQAPSRTAGRVRAFDGRSGQRLASLLDLTLAEFLAIVDTVNLLARWPGKHGGKYAYREKGDRFPIATARRKANRLKKELHALRHPVVVLCGRRVARAFGVEGEFLSRHRRGGIQVLLFPHPSGCSQWWNDPKNVRAARRALLDAFSAVTHCFARALVAA